MTIFRKLWQKFMRSFDRFMETTHTRDKESRGGLLRLGALCTILSLAISVVFRASLSNSLIPNNLAPISVIKFIAIELILGATTLAIFLKITRRIGLEFLVVAVILVAFGILIWSNLSNAIT